MRYDILPVELAKKCIFYVGWLGYGGMGTVDGNRKWYSFRENNLIGYKKCKLYTPNLTICVTEFIL